MQTWEHYEDAQDPEYVCYPFIPENEFSIVFGEGGSGKSLLALLTYICISVPYTDNPYGLDIRKTYPGLYLDWESSAARTRYNIRKIVAGAQIDPPTFHYLHMSRSLADSIDQVENAAAKIGGVGFVILDSLGAAAGGDLNSTEPAFKLIHAVRELNRAGISVWAIAHTAKNQDPKQKRTVYGSVYYTNEARTVWELRRAESTDEHVTEVGLFHSKSNISGFLPSFGFKISFLPNSINFEHIGVTTVPEFVAMLGLQSRIKESLKHGKANVKDICQAVNASGTVVSSTLYRMRQRGLVQRFAADNSWGLPQPDINTQSSRK